MLYGALGQRSYKQHVVEVWVSQVRCAAFQLIFCAIWKHVPGSGQITMPIEVVFIQ